MSLVCQGISIDAITESEYAAWRELSSFRQSLNAALKGKLAGAVVLIDRAGEIESTSAGWRDIETCLSMQRDTIFRIASIRPTIG